MKITAKKIIAREFLFFISVVILGLIAFLCTYPYNIYNQKKIDEFSNQVEIKQRLADSLSIKETSQNIKYTQLYSYIKNENMTDLNTIEFYQVYSSDINKFKSLYSFLKENQLTDLNIANFYKEYFSNALGSNLTESKSIYKILNEINILRTQKNEQINLVLNFDEQTVFGINSLIVLAILLFGLRYLFYAIKWSIKILYHKS